MTMPVPASSMAFGMVPASVEPEAPAMDAEVARAFRTALTAALGEPASTRGRRRVSEPTTDPTVERQVVEALHTPATTSATAPSTTDAVPALKEPASVLAPRTVVTEARVDENVTLAAHAAVAAIAVDEAVEWIPEEELIPVRADVEISEKNMPAIVVAPIALPSIEVVRPIDRNAQASRSSNLALLAPEFRGRLERVVERMEREFGVTVEVIETGRSQERQDALFAQGRTAPGPVVTWTRASRHSRGLAADVTVNGGWTDRAAFERLAVVAREEGLRTPGPRDPGHIELVTSPPTVIASRTPEWGGPPAVTSRGFSHPAGDVAPVIDAASHVHNGGTTADGEVRILPWYPTPDEGARHAPDEWRGTGRSTGWRAETTNPRLSLGATSQKSIVGEASPKTGGTPAVVSAVAHVAAVATVASTARVEAPGRAAGRAMPDESNVRGPIAIESRRHTADVRPAEVRVTERAIERAPVLAPMETTPAGTAPADGEALPDFAPGGGQADTAAFVASAVSTANLADQEFASLMQGARTAPAVSQGTESLERTDAVERIARVLRLQDSAGERPMTSVTLRLDHPDGGEDRIRIDLRGRAVASTFEVGSQQAANELRVHAHELQAALGRRGLEGEGVVVRVASESLSLATAAAGERETVRAAASQSSSGASNGGQQRDHRAPRDSNPGARDHDNHGSRPRRDQGGRRS